MRKANLKKGIYAFICLTFTFVIALLLGNDSMAGESRYIISSEKYESDAGFSLSALNSVESLSYGKIGSFYISGKNARETKKDGIVAYAIEEQATFGYISSSKDYLTKNEEQWNLCSSGEKQVGDIALSNSVAKGVFIIQKSKDAQMWTNACEPIYDFFNSKKIDFNSLYVTSDTDIKNGTFYRIIVAYEMKKKIGTEKDFLWEKDVFENRFFVEEYRFYLCYSNNPVSLFELNYDRVVPNNSTVVDGFKIDCHGANAKITVKKDYSAERVAKSLDSFYAPGKYNIKVTSPLGDVYESNITISDGLSTSNVPVICYANSEKDGYKRNNIVSDGKPLTSLMIGQKAGTSIKSANHDGYSGFGITGKSVGLYLRLQTLEEVSNSGREIVSDDYGKGKNELIEGVSTKQIETGALIIQKSFDGKNWEKISEGQYANGLNTSDYYALFANNGDVLIYKPNGQEINKGIYLRILYAYEIKERTDKEKKRCIEEYSFYLCNDALGAVTFHNLTTDGKIEDNICGKDNEIELKMDETFETMSSGAVTVSGFKIDTSQNPTVTFSVKKDGVPVNNKRQIVFTETGKYTIELKSAVGSVEEVTLFIDRMSTEETLKRYFGDGFIEGKRIFSEGQYPVYEGGYTDYLIKDVGQNYQPLYGDITNITTGSSKTISTSKGGIRGKISEPGEYIVTLNNNPTFMTDAKSGDNKVISFHFTIIAEGSAPGPKINRENLDKSVKESISGTYPKYYGLVYSSAAAGNITLAFASREAAFKYAYNYEKGTVETQADGTYLYTGSFIVKQKTRYESNWDLTDAINYFAEQAIHEMYFDVSDEATYLTLEDDLLTRTANPRTLELKRSVVIFADGQEELLTNLDALPIVNAKPYAYLTPGLNGNTKAGTSYFEFIKDKYGCDSNTIEIEDAQGEVYSIEYDKNIDAQLASLGCKTGKIVIKETTVYGDTSSYEAVYFAEGDNTTVVTLSCFQEGDNNRLTMTQIDQGKTLYADAFSIVDIKDDLDPYSLVLLKDSEGNTNSFVANQPANGAWSNEGEYEISVINRLGNKYVFKLVISETDYATINFEGEGTEDFKGIIVKKGEKNVALPVPKKYGYDFAGYTDFEGNIYEDVIRQIGFNGTKSIRPLWRPKKVNVVLKDGEGKVIETITADYGSDIVIPNPKLEDGLIFEGWILNDAKIPDGKIKITKEEDISVVASFSIKESKVEYEKTEENEELKAEDNKQNNKSVLIAIIVIIIVSGVSFGGWKRFTTKSDNN